MKILYVTRVPSTAFSFVLPLAARMRERGHIVEFSFGPGIGLKEMQSSGFPFTLISMDMKSDSPKNINVLSQLSAVMKKGQYDVVHTFSPVIGFYGRLAAYNTKIPIVIHSVIGSMLGSGVHLLHRFLFIATELITSRLVDLFITLNDEDARTMVKYRLASAEKVASLKYEYGIDLTRFDPDAIDSNNLDEARRKYGLLDGIPAIGFVGRMTGAKGILDLFEAYKIIRAKGIRIKLLFLGDVISTDKDQSSIKLLEERVKESGYEEDVIYLGRQLDVPFYISLMDIVVHPTHHEGFPRIPVEAGAMGKPSVCTAVSGANIAVDDGKTGFIVPIRNPQRLAEATLQLLTDPHLARTFGDAARKRATELFNENTIVDQQVQIYEDFFNSRKLKNGFRV